MILEAATPALRCYVLLCSDLAMRSGTAATICPNNYDKEAGTVTFKTKYNAQLTLPVTRELAELFQSVSGEQDMPYIGQLGRVKKLKAASSMSVSFYKLRKKLGITRKLTAHDLRRTTAVKTYEITKDLRIVQAVLGHKHLETTLIYLDHRNTKVEVSLLELAKLNPETETIQ